VNVVHRDIRPSVAAAANRYAIVRRSHVGADACSLFVEDHDETMSRIVVSVLPDREGADELKSQGLHALSVKLEIGRSGELSCSALFRSATGPVRLPVSEGIALALCVDGGRTVVTRH